MKYVCGRICYYEIYWQTCQIGLIFFSIFDILHTRWVHNNITWSAYMQMMEFDMPLIVTGVLISRNKLARVLFYVTVRLSHDYSKRTYKQPGSLVCKTSTLLMSFYLIFTKFGDDGCWHNISVRFDNQSDYCRCSRFKALEHSKHSQSLQDSSDLIVMFVCIIRRPSLISHGLEALLRVVALAKYNIGKKALLPPKLWCLTVTPQTLWLFFNCWWAFSISQVMLDELSNNSWHSKVMAL